jgi:hypothetical protein
MDISMDSFAAKEAAMTSSSGIEELERACLSSRGYRGRNASLLLDIDDIARGFAWDRSCKATEHRFDRTIIGSRV